MATTQKLRGDLLKEDLVLTGDVPVSITLPIAESDVTNLTTDLAAKLVKVNNLSDVADASTSRTNLGLGTSATKDVGVITGTVAAGDDSRLTDSRTPIAHATSHENGGSDEISVAGLSGQLADPQPPIIGATGSTAVAGNDSRLTDSRNPLAHKTSHQDSGSDEIDVTGLSGVLADPQHPIIGSGATQAVAGNDARLTDARTPSSTLAHKTSHQDGGSDEIDVTGLSGLLGDAQPLLQSIVANVTLAANSSLIAVRKFALADGIKLKLGDGSIFRMI